eukprot:CAMPEP_0201592484 /NCGR_PEP_ID=MMETSP0190_2-20130828/190369_1 /ASSEMBLY_ACC=CAM_ASM_000263 /TAXON_ID=37353 /ORGANISM="Rosalina sp." /LENGTH=43 /DNA_ID= /DNA_START= /DNA_END= /DNA_ORIENTATION=
MIDNYFGSVVTLAVDVKHDLNGMDIANNATLNDATLNDEFCVL